MNITRETPVELLAGLWQSSVRRLCSSVRVDTVDLEKCYQKRSTYQDILPE